MRPPAETPSLSPSSPGAMVLSLEDKGMRTDMPTRSRVGHTLSRVRRMRSCFCRCWARVPLLQP